jgi:hypothetical protein
MISDDPVAMLEMLDCAVHLLPRFRRDLIERHFASPKPTDELLCASDGRPHACGLLLCRRAPRYRSQSWLLLFPHPRRQPRLQFCLRPCPIAASPAVPLAHLRRCI